MVVSISRRHVIAIGNGGVIGVSTVAGQQYQGKPPQMEWASA
ncbi:hypothetical protein [Moraxella lacunata]